MVGVWQGGRAWRGWVLQCQEVPRGDTAQVQDRVVRRAGQGMKRWTLATATCRERHEDKKGTKRTKTVKPSTY